MTKIFISILCLLVMPGCSNFSSSNDSSSETIASVEQTQEKPFSKDQEYAMKMGNYMDEFSSTMYDISDLMMAASQDMTLLDNHAWNTAINTSLKDLQAIINNIKTSKPTPAFEDVHEQLLQAMEHYQFVVDSYPKAIANKDKILFNNITGEIYLGKSKLDLVMVLLEGKVKDLTDKNSQDDSVYQSSINDVKVNSNEEPSVPVVNDSTIEEFMQEYAIAGMDAIRQNDFSFIESFLNPQGKAYQESKNYIQYINSKNISEEILDFQVDDITQLDETSYKVSTSEQYEITYSSGTTKIKDYQNEYLVKVLANDRLVVSELLNTVEVSSQEM